MARELEHRTCEITDCALAVIETEERAEGTPPVIEGYASVFDKWSVDMFGWKEKIARGAFADNLKTNPDVRALIDHNSSLMLGRTTAGTLTLEEDKKGLKARITPPDTTVANDLIANMRIGNINQMSFAFQTVEEEWNERYTERVVKRADLFDVSVVTYPAYKQASVKVRSALEAAGIDDTALARIAARAKLGLPIDPEDEAAARAITRKLSELIPSIKADAEIRAEILAFLFDIVKHA